MRKGQYIRNAAIHDTYNRCVTVHGTNNLRVENNVTYNTVGHCFFLEDGIEHGNQFVHNLAIQTKCHTTKPCVPTNLAANGDNDYPYEKRLEVRKISFAAKDMLLPSDNTVAAYWITNPDNTYHRQRGRRFRRERFLAVPAGAPERSVRGHGHQQGHLATSNQDPGIQGQRRPLQLRRVHVRPEHQRGQHLWPHRQLAHAHGKSR